MTHNKHLLAIFIMGSEVRQFVHSGLFHALIGQGWTISVMAKLIDKDLPGQLPGEVNLLPLIINRPPFIANEISRVLDKAFNLRRSRQGQSTWQYGSVPAKNWRQSLLFKLEGWLAKALSYSACLMKAFSQVERWLFIKADRSPWQSYFTAHPTVAILVNVPRQSHWNLLFTTAQEFGIKSFLIYHTVKDITANGRLNHAFSGIGVWNARMKADLLKNNPWLEPETIKIVGSGHFDCIGRADWLPEEAVFRAQIGAHANIQLIVYTTAGPGIVPQEERYIDFVVKAAKAAETALKKPIQIVFRMNPMDNREVLFDHLRESYPEHIVLRPDWVDIRQSNWTYAKKEDPPLYNALLHYASLCITIPSTVTIDAALSDLPVINLGIEAPGEQPLAGSIRAFWEVDFNLNVRETGAAKFVSSFVELEQAMIYYLADKTLDAEKRQDLVLREVEGICCGSSSQRVIHLIENLMDKHG